LEASYLEYFLVLVALNGVGWLRGRWLHCIKDLGNICSSNSSWNVGRSSLAIPPPKASLETYCQIEEKRSSGQLDSMFCQPWGF